MARLFDDASDQSLSYSGAIISGYPFTIAGWIRSDDTTVGQTIIAITDGSVSERIWVACRGQIAGDPISLGISQASSHTLASTTTGYAANTWHHFCAIGRSATDRSVFIDGGSEGTSSTNTTPGSLSESRIGANYITSNAPFSGRIAEVGVWDVGLNSSEMSSLSKGFSPRDVRPQSLVAYYPLIRNDLDIINNQNMTPVNSPTVAEHTRIIYPMPLFGWSIPAAAGGDLSISVSESVTVAEAVTTKTTSFIDVSDSIAAAEAVTMLIENIISVSDSITVAEAVNLAIAQQISVSDSVSVAESTTLMVDENISVSDSVSVSETVTMLETSFVDVSESITVSESVSVSVVDAGTVTISVSDSVSVSESVTMLGTSFIDVSDSVSVSESVSVTTVTLGTLTISVSDSVSVSEAVVMALTPLLIDVSESITVADVVTISLLVGLIDLTLRDRDTTLTLRDRDTTLTLQKRY